MEERTVRELSGEIWAEITMEQNFNKESILNSIETKAKDEILDFVMRVLARHDGKKIVIDSEMPVEPLPYRFNPEDENE